MKVALNTNPNTYTHILLRDHKSNSTLWEISVHLNKYKRQNWKDLKLTVREIWGVEGRVRATEV
jgi:hypothetical protein